MKFLGILFIFFFIFPYVFRWLIKAFVASQVNKAQQHFQQQQTNYQRPNPKQEGKITVDYAPPKSDKNDFRGGEYVDYEEVK
jgi:hypothetical protein